MQDERHEHWRKVYTDKQPDEVSWYQATPAPSLDALVRLGAGPEKSLIDIGGGASGLVDALLDHGWRDLTVLDIAAPALAAVRARLGQRATMVKWQVADVTMWQPERRYDIWHDRAVFHFLTAPEQRAAYLHALEAGLAMDGFAIIATFAPDGPERCSGLPVERYDAPKLAATLGPRFQLVADWCEEHLTPWGSPQAFTWCTFRRTATA